MTKYSRKLFNLYMVHHPINIIFCWFFYGFHPANLAFAFDLLTTNVIVAKLFDVSSIMLVSPTFWHSIKGQNYIFLCSVYWEGRQRLKWWKVIVALTCIRIKRDVEVKQESRKLSKAPSLDLISFQYSDIYDNRTKVVTVKYVKIHI